MWCPSGSYRRVEYESEADLEPAILETAPQLFGAQRLYVNVKKKIGRNIPDGYLLDLSSNPPVLYFVEVEVKAHDPYRHIAVQLLQFSMSFDEDKWRVKDVLYSALRDQRELWRQCEEFVERHRFNSVDHLLEAVIQAPFSALVVIDDASDMLETLLTQKLRFPVEVLQLQRFENDRAQRQYLFEPLLADVRRDLAVRTDGARQPLMVRDIDTIVVPARPEGFEQVFLGEHVWRSVRIHGSMLDQIKYIAAYQVAPESAITHVAPVKTIRPAPVEQDKYELVFSEPAHSIGPVTLAPNGRVRPLRNLRYTTMQRLQEAKTLDDLW